MSTKTTTQTVASHLVPADTVAETPGESAPYELGPLAGKTVLLLLRVTDIVEQESLHVAIWGSEDGKTWGGKPLFWFPERFYQGVTPAALDLGQRPEVKFLEARWEVNRWGRCDPRPYFKFAVEVQEAGP